MKTFNYPRFIDFLQSVRDRDYTKEAAADILLDYFDDPSFGAAFYSPNPDIDQEKLRKYQKEIYELLGTRRMMGILIDSIELEGCDCFDRTTACFLYSVAYRAMQASNHRLKDARDAEKSLDAGYTQKYSRSDIEKIEQGASEINDRAYDLLRICKKIVRRDAKRIEADTNLNRDFASQLLLYVPKTNFIENHQIGLYMNTILRGLYGYVHANRVSTENVKWDKVFQYILGEKSIYEAATSILLEGNNRIDQYCDKNGEIDPYVEEAWDTLSQFALEALEKSPADIQSHMMDLYTKKVNRMISNGSKDIRVNMLKISPNRYPELTSAVSKYSDRLKELLDSKPAGTSTPSIDMN